MEPVSILLATGAIAVYAAHRAEQISEKARRGPVTLPEMMAAPAVDDESMVQVLAVHVRSSTLGRRLLGERLKVRIKYGDPGASIHCDTAEVTAVAPPPDPAALYVARLQHHESEHQVTADFGTTCLFLGQRYSENIIRLRLMRAAILGSKCVGKAELRIPALYQQAAWTDHKIELEGPANGLLHIALEVRMMPKGDLRQYLELLGAQQKQEAFLMGILPVTEGEVSQQYEASSSFDETHPIVKGKYITAQARPRRKGSCLGNLCHGSDVGREASE